MYPEQKFLHNLILKNKDKRIALISEYGQYWETELKKRGVNFVETFGVRDLGKKNEEPVCRGKFSRESQLEYNFDILIAIRPCQAEKIIIDVAEEFGIKFGIILCNCKNDRGMYAEKRAEEFSTKFTVKKINDNFTHWWLVTNIDLEE